MAATGVPKDRVNFGPDVPFHLERKAFEGSANMPVALISKGTLPEQKVVVGTVGTIVDLLSEQNIASPTLTIIGSVVNLREKLRWLD